MIEPMASRIAGAQATGARKMNRIADTELMKAADELEEGRERVGTGGATLGICLGLQLALEESEEDDGVVGLGILPGRAQRLREGRVPRIGWATVEPGGEAFYFAHSYAAETPAATARSEGVVAVAEWGSFVGVQFHPEKSGAAGLRFLERCLSRA